MQSVTLPSSVKGQLYVDSVYRERCSVYIGKQLVEQQTVPSLEGLKTHLKPSDYIKCTANAKIFNECLARSNTTINKYLHNFLYSAATDTVKLNWYICIAVKAGISNDIIIEQARNIWTNLYLIKFWDHIEEKGLH